MKYPFKEVEEKWLEHWRKNDSYKTNLSDTEKKHYVLVMFSYPSGAKLHCGHWYNYGPTDSFARYKKLQGYNVYEPMGFDAFGLPAENYAIKTGIHPYDSTMQNIKDIKVQLERIGCMYDWNSYLMTCTPEYYKWNQWLFLQMYKKGLAYRKNAPVNWCPSCQTVLANEQVQNDGSCERCDTTVNKKNLTQWFFKITEYADELLDGLQKIDWPEKTKLMQTNWIGKSFGAEIEFPLVGSDKKIKVFTTRPDTLCGVTYVVIAPELELVQEITTPEYIKEVNEYINKCKTLTEIERTSTTREKTGANTGAFVINPVNGKKVPVLIADYALANYGTGCVMAVPGHDERDYDFAKKYNLPIIKVILQDGTTAEDELTAAFTEIGTMINSDKFDGLNSDEGKVKIVEYLEENNWGRKTTNYRLRDWLISRQRYWGTPIPIIYCDTCGEVPVPEEQLPLELPYDVKFSHDGSSPLARCEEFINTPCPKCGKPAKRDADTMDTFVDSSWYYLRYLNPNADSIFDQELANNWVPVDTYVGGAEHATMHLLYSRFIHKFLRDLGLTNSDEPFQRLIHQGTITNQGAKMSKSKGNVVNPDDFTIHYGSDVFRMYLMFMGPYELGGDWSDKGITGVDRFVQRAYTLITSYEGISKKISSNNIYDIESLNVAEKAVYRKINQTLKKYSEDMENFRFNTVISSLMELLNEITKNIAECKEEIINYTIERFVYMLAPVAPHLGEEAWSIIGKPESIFEKPVVFSYDEKALTNDEVTIAVQILGKLRATINVPINSDEAFVKNEVMQQKNVLIHLEGKTIVKEIYVKNKIYNIVIK